MTAFNGTPLTGACPERSRRNANGNLTADGTNTYTLRQEDSQGGLWDARNHLTGIAGAVAASFLYDAMGRRMSKTIAGSTTQFLYDRLNPVQELDGASPPNVTANVLTGLGIDEYFSRTDSSGAMSFLRDALGSTVALTDSTGALGTQYTYQPFGATTVSGPANANPYQYTGREADGTGLYFYRARYYSQTFQRFVSQDPIGFAGGDPNLYGYTFDSPTNLRDPSGRIVGILIAGGLFGCGCTGLQRLGCVPERRDNRRAICGSDRFWCLHGRGECPSYYFSICRLHWWTSSVR
jgi:RHS repeat-associated protein